MILVDSIGELSAVVGACRCFVRRRESICGPGGQNTMEPAGYGSAVLFGSHTENFRDAVEGLLASQAAVQVETPTGLTSALSDALADPEAADRRGSAARVHSCLANKGPLIGRSPRLKSSPPPRSTP